MKYIYGKTWCKPDVNVCMTMSKEWTNTHKSCWETSISALTGTKLSVSVKKTLLSKSLSLFRSVFIVYLGNYMYASVFSSVLSLWYSTCTNHIGLMVWIKGYRRKIQRLKTCLQMISINSSVLLCYKWSSWPDPIISNTVMYWQRCFLTGNTGGHVSAIWKKKL